MINGHKLSMSPSVSSPTVAFGQFGYATHQNNSGAASPTTPLSVSGSSCCEPLSLRLSTGTTSGQHGLIPNSASTIHSNPNSVTQLTMDAISSNRFNATTGGLANVSHHHNSPTPSAFYATKPSAYPDPSYCNPTVIDPTVGFYQTLPSYGFKDAAAAAPSWAHGIAAQSAAANYYYDPAFTQYGYSSSYDFNGSANRRKNAARESTMTLKAWLNEHHKNPYPTKGEKIMLAIITKMTLTQVSTWFANARRRLKKENKMTWEPRNKSSDGHDSDDKESCKDTDDNSSSNIGDNQCLNGGNKLSVKKETDSLIEKSTTMTEMNARNTNSDSTSASYDAKDIVVEKSHSGHLHNGHETKPTLSHQINNNSRSQIVSSHHHIKHDSPANMLDNVTNIETIGQRPKIWSLAQTATSESPPYSGKVASITPTEWATTLPPGPDGLSLSDYQRECPQGSRLSAGNLRKCQTTWPEEQCVTNLGSSRSSAMQLFTSDSIGPNYLNSHSGKPATSGSAYHHNYPHHHPFSTSIPHLVHANHDSFSTAYNVASNGMRPIIDSQTCHSLGSDINENRLSNGSITKSNTFLCKVFPEYISSGPDALSLNDNNSERGGSTLSIEDSSMSSSSSPNLESHAMNTVRHHLNGANTLGFSAFRPMLKR